MTDRKGASAPGFLRDYNDASAVTHEEWLWLSQWLIALADNVDDQPGHVAKLRMAAAGCRLLHEQMRESGDG